MHKSFRGVSTPVFTASIVVLVVLAAAGFTLYATKPSTASTVTVQTTVPTTVTATTVRTAKILQIGRA
ncbi:MAG: hypothetical protein M1357_03185, partial [Candidatus Marsarchaeota archaeon]|nr:hypothetical protein [Candidatus Marsarchaeota archaeon]